MKKYTYFNRDLSWLSFNERVLMEASNKMVPLMERIKFLCIFSSNLDEFYRVRMPVMLRNKEHDLENSVYDEATAIISSQQNFFGKTLNETIIPELRKSGVHFCYQEKIPESLSYQTSEYFFCQVAGLLQPVLLQERSSFFLENDMLYILVIFTNEDAHEQLAVVNIPTDHLDRFVKLQLDGEDYIIFLDEIIRQNLKSLFPKAVQIESFNIKVNRDAELDLLDDEGPDMTEILERQLRKRKYGLPTRFLYEPGLLPQHLETITEIFELKQASVLQGGKYHNSKDLATLPVKNQLLSYPDWPMIRKMGGINQHTTLFETMANQDLMVHAPYQTYDTILRFFNEAAIDPDVEEVYTTMYRVAHDSKIALALISAAKNGKKVVVLVELKARFDEANNLHWANIVPYN